jgi:peptidoglycan/xylan/chitin deacetylase (PgdA/CDA1 family)
MIPMRLTRFIARMTNVRPVRLDNSAPIASITFDDFPKSAWETGGKILAHHNVLATYYVAGGFCGRRDHGTRFYDESDLRALAAAGHEIACHGFSHEPASLLSDAALEADNARNAQFLAPFLGERKLESYAYPYGAVSIRAKRFFASRFTNIRGVHPGINQGVADFSQLNAFSLEQRSFSRHKLAHAIADALTANGWICFYSHDVSDSPSAYGSTPEILTEVLGSLAAAGIRVLPMGAAARLTGGSAARSAA